MSTRDQLTEKLQYLGATVKNGVTRNTSVLLIGSNPGQTKTEAAHKHGTPTLWMPFADYCTLFDERTTNNLTTLPNDFVSELALIISTLAEDLYVLSHTPGLERHRSTAIRAAGTVRALLDGAYGQVSPRDRTNT